MKINRFALALFIIAGATGVTLFASNYSSCELPGGRVYKANDGSWSAWCPNNGPCRQDKVIEAMC